MIGGAKCPRLVGFLVVDKGVNGGDDLLLCFFHASAFVEDD